MSFSLTSRETYCSFCRNHDSFIGDCIVGFVAVETPLRICSLPSSFTYCCTHYMLSLVSPPFVLYFFFLSPKYLPSVVHALLAFVSSSCPPLSLRLTCMYASELNLLYSILSTTECTCFDYAVSWCGSGVNAIFSLPSLFFLASFYCDVSLHFYVVCRTYNWIRCHSQLRSYVLVMVFFQQQNPFRSTTFFQSILFLFALYFFHLL